MQKPLHALLVTFAFATLCAAEPQWMTNVPTALTRAKAQKKMVLLDFTGSDWCGWCIKFKEEALSKPEFSQYAAKNLVLVELDFPHKKPLSPALKKANKALQEKYNVEGFPTFVVLNDQGKEVGRQVGYSKGGAKAFIAKLEKFRGK
jgi:protein disulfide-isomerase